MAITWVPQSSKLTATVNNSERYSEDNFSGFGNGHIYLQSHWGSGVVFTSANFAPGN